jgi:hypothetical protein
MKGISFGVIYIYDAFDGSFTFGLFAVHLFNFRSFAVRSFAIHSFAVFVCRSLLAVLSCSFAVRSCSFAFICRVFVLCELRFSLRDSHSAHRTSYHALMRRLF